MEYSEELQHAGVKGMKWGVRKEEPESTGSTYSSQGTTNSYTGALKRNTLAAVNRLSQMGIVGGVTYAGARVAKKRGKKAAAAVLSTIGTMTVAGLGAAMVADLARNNTRDPNVQHSELTHWGIKGMKWGVRRYQNPDGSLTAAGKRRQARQPHEDYQKAHTRKKLKQMSNNELKEINKRLEAEANYKRLTSQGKMSAGKVLKGFVAGATTISALVGAVATYKKLGGQALDKIGDWVVSGIDLKTPLN